MRRGGSSTKLYPTQVLSAQSNLIIAKPTPLDRRDTKYADVQAIGAGAVNQAVKAIVLATDYLKEDGIDVSFVPEFGDVTINDQVRTAIKLVVNIRQVIAEHYQEQK